MSIIPKQHRPKVRRRNDFVRAIERILAGSGITDFEFGVRGNSHRFIAIRHNGQERRITFSNTSKCPWGHKNASGDVRRAIRAMAGGNR
jgi:hypothetical protein